LWYEKPKELHRFTGRELYHMAIERQESFGEIRAGRRVVCISGENVALVAMAGKWGMVSFTPG